MDLTKKEGEPGFFIAANLDADEQLAIKGAYSEEFIGQLRSSEREEELPKIENEDFVLQIMELKSNSTIEIRDAAIGGIVRALDVFHNNTPERVRHMALHTNSHDHRNVMWSERFRLGKIADRMSKQFDAVLTGIVEDFKNSIADSVTDTPESEVSPRSYDTSDKSPVDEQASPQ